MIHLYDTKKQYSIEQLRELSLLIKEDIKNIQGELSDYTFCINQKCILCQDLNLQLLKLKESQILVSRQL